MSESRTYLLKRPQYANIARFQVLQQQGIQL
nr:MAG TPA: hypothetical protein [Caudoviricetes sp.]